MLLIHGSGPGVTAFANWRLVMPRLAEHHRVVAPDMIGFGYTEASDLRFDLSRWVRHCVDLLDALDIERIAVVGNSFGGAVGLRLAIDHPGRVDHLILMGASATAFPLTEGLDRFGDTSLPSRRCLICSVTCSSSTAARSPTTWSK